MSLYRPKNVTVEAWCHDGSRDSAERLKQICGCGDVFWDAGHSTVGLPTLGGHRYLGPTDWLVRTEEGFWAHDDDGFRARYEPVEPGLRA